MALDWGPQFAVGLLWYRTSLTLTSMSLSAFLFFVRSTSCLQEVAQYGTQIETVEGRKMELLSSVPFGLGATDLTVCPTLCPKAVSNSLRFFGQQNRRRAVFLYVCHLYGILFDPLAHHIEDKRERRGRLDGSGARVGPRDGVPTVDERRRDGC